MAAPGPAHPVRRTCLGCADVRRHAGHPQRAPLRVGGLLRRLDAARLALAPPLAGPPLSVGLASTCRVSGRGEASQQTKSQPCASGESGSTSSRLRRPSSHSPLPRAAFSPSPATASGSSRTTQDSIVRGLAGSSPAGIEPLWRLTSSAPGEVSGCSSPGPRTVPSCGRSCVQGSLPIGSLDIWSPTSSSGARRFHSTRPRGPALACDRAGSSCPRPPISRSSRREILSSPRPFGTKVVQRGLGTPSYGNKKGPH